MKSIKWLVFLCVLCVFSMGATPMQGTSILPEAKITITTARTGVPSALLEWEADRLLESEERTYNFTGRAPVQFNSLVVNWESSDPKADPTKFQVAIRTRVSEGSWSEWWNIQGSLCPGGVLGYVPYMTYFMSGESRVHTDFEVRVRAPRGISLTFARLLFANTTTISGLKVTGLLGEPSSRKASAITAFAAFPRPPIIPRSDWWGNLPPGELNSPRWAPIYRNITHALIHHTVTANNPPDPKEVVRSIWIYHATVDKHDGYPDGWGDIGYNFLIDHLGNIYHGRYNPQLDTQDVHAAHAGKYNYRSLGVALIGQFHPPEPSPPPGVPDPRALRSTESLLAWKFDQRNLDPLGKATLVDKFIYRIAGHRDVKATACPGNNLWNLLPTIRSNVQDLISGGVPVAPTVETRSATNITGAAATINGEITDDGGATIDERRFSWGSTPSCSDGWVTDDPGSDHYGDINVSGNNFSYDLTDLDPYTTYYFQAWAHNSAGWDAGEPLSFTTTVPSYPDLIIEDIWIEPSQFYPGDEVKLYQRTKNIGDGDAVGTFRIQRYFDGSAVSHADKNGLAAGESYTSYYTYIWPLDCDPHTIKVVVDVNEAITESNENNNERSETFTAAGSAPGVPTGVNATDGMYTDKVRVTWNSVSGADSYRVYRSTSSGGTKTALGSWQSGTSYNDYSPTPGTTYYYWVKARNSYGESDYSSFDTGWRKLLPPTGVSASDGTYTDRVSIDWNSVSGASYYQVYRATSAGETKTPISSWQGSTSYDDYSASGGTTYYYWARAATSSSGSRASGYSDYDTGWASVTPPIRVLTIASFNPNSGVYITVSPIDKNGNSNGTTTFTRIYNDSTVVYLTAPSTAPGGNSFKEWQLNGAFWTSAQTVVVAMLADYTLTAVYNAPPPAISVTPASRDFGSVQVGFYVDGTFTVQNTGGGTLSGSASTSAPFSIVSGGTYNLSAGQSQTVTVRFSPTAAQSYNGTVTFTGGGGATRPVSGTGLLQKYTITATFGENGAVEPNGVIDVDAGQNLTFTAQPNHGYTVDQWYLDGNSVQRGNTSYTLYNVQADHNVLVTFKTSVLYVDANSPNDPGTGTPEDPYRRIQDGIDTAIDGVTIIVADGTYKENIDFNGKAIVVMSEHGPANTAIHGRGIGDVVIGATGSTIQGFTITGSGNAWYDCGIQAMLSAMTIRGNIITGNWLGINTSNYKQPLIQNNLIYNNAHYGIVASNYSAPTIINNTIAFNGEHGILSSSGTGLVVNNIIVLNGSNGIFCTMPGSRPEIRYNDVYGNQMGDYSGCVLGDGDISAEPFFVDGNNPDPNLRDYHLLPSSPCIDTGDPNYVADANEVDIDGDARVIGGRIDIGADEYAYGELSDFNGDGIVNFKDFSILAYYWMDYICSESDWCEGSDFDESRYVDFGDLKTFAENWLWQAIWYSQ